MPKKSYRIGFKKELCKRCGVCVHICPKDVFDEDPLGYPVIARVDQCIGCMLCEQHCPDFAMWVQDAEGNPPEHPSWKWLRTEHLPTAWCPGCGIGTVLYSITKALDELGIDKNKLVMTSGIGCSSRMPGYLDANTLHTTHGRSLAFATGIKMANPDLQVIAVMGDGDAAAIGGNHLIHAARRNLDIVAIVINNYNYGMTGGQGSPTTPYGARTTTTPYGAVEPAFDLVELMKGAGANYVARVSVYHVPLMVKMIKEAFQTPGFAFIDVISNCPTYFGRFNQAADPYQSLLKAKDEVGRPGRLAEGQFPMGVIHKGERRPLHELYQELVKNVKGGS